MTKELKAEPGEFTLTGTRPWLLSFKERLRLLDEYRAENPLEEFPYELQRIVDSFTSKERAVYRQRSEAFRLYYQAVQDLQRAAGAYQEAVAYGKGLTMLQESLKSMDEVIAEMTSKVLDTKQLQKSLPKSVADKLPGIEKALGKVLEKAVLSALDTKQMETLAKVEYDKKLRAARLIFKRTEEGTIDENRESWLEEAQDLRRNIFTVLKALREGMKKIAYRPRTFTEQLDLVGEIINEAVMSYPVLPPGKGKNPKRGRAAKGTLTLLEKGSNIPINEELYKEWIEAIESTKSL